MILLIATGFQVFMESITDAKTQNHWIFKTFFYILAHVSVSCSMYFFDLVPTEMTRQDFKQMWQGVSNPKSQ